MDQKFTDRVWQRMGSMPPWRYFAVTGAFLVLANVGISLAITYYLFQDTTPEILYRALGLAFFLPLILVTLAWIGFNRVFFVMSRANQSLRQVAERDSLTRLSNRSAFYRRGRQIFAQAQRMLKTQDRAPLSLVMVDVDHFKAVNDALGHLAGDQALRHISAIIARSCRESDMPARWGGEEFAILLENADRGSAQLVAERIRATAAQEPFIWEGQPFYITLSAGVTEMHPNDGKLEDVVLRADLALYYAKSSGRNRVHAPAVTDPETCEGLTASAASSVATGLG
ncbi:MAG: GGDEF domain-containing protein [Cohaesibacter sp.]|jgi:diguanylate cyclase (GGDEF)-like protein|nr:GGDEF domain-containing protein [Cohaesibacter sp.]